MHDSDTIFINTRPAHQAKELSTLIRQHGFVCHELPTLIIQALPMASWQSQLPSQAEVAIFTSGNAVDGALPNLKRINYSLPKRVIAVGAATQLKLAHEGYTQSLRPVQPCSESILAMPIWQEIAPASTIIVVTGRDGRTLIQQQLGKRYVVKTVAVYQRGLPTDLKQRLKALQQQHNRVTWLVTSTQTIDHIIDNCDADTQDWLLRQQWVALSARITAHGQMRGLNNIMTIETAGFEAYFRSLS